MLSFLRSLFATASAPAPAPAPRSPVATPAPPAPPAPPLSRRTPPAPPAPAPALRVFDPNGHPAEIGDSIGRGGEASIHPIVGHDGVLVKLYHPQALARTERTRALHRKLAVMTRLTQLHEDPRYAWPRFEVFDEQGRWAGFAMSRVEGRPLTLLLAPALIRRELPRWDGRHLVAVVGNLARHLEFLAEQDIIVGDINPGNFLLDPKTGKVGLIDCDSFQVKTAGGLFPCPVVTPTHAAPELLALGRPDAPRTVEMLRFSAAILFYQILTVGLHPFQYKGCDDPADNIRAGKCAIGTGGAYLPAAAWERYNRLPGYIKNLFRRAFRDGHAEPALRPSLAEWTRALTRFFKEVSRPANAPR
jgi:Uncharacterized protein with protein kinase and helix-hairpin-helix DNA-binding domains